MYIYHINGIRACNYLLSNGNLMAKENKRLRIVFDRNAARGDEEAPHLL